MSGASDDPRDPPARDEVTERTRAHRTSAAPRSRLPSALAPEALWQEPTPDEDQVTAYAAPIAYDARPPREDAPAPPPLPGFLPDSAPAPDEVTGSEVEVIDAEPEDASLSDAPSPQEVAWLAADLDASPAGDDDLGWEEAEEVYDGDGPFAAPVDEPRTVAASPMDRIAEALRQAPRGELPGLGLSGRRRNLVAPEVKAELHKPHTLKRRAPSMADAAPQTVGDLRRRAPAPRPPGRAPTRHYPEMRALLRDPDRVPYGIEPPIPAGKPAVPGTFFPTPRGPDERPQAADLDALLSTMAEGLLIGETPDGGTEVRVTLKDEFFAGTELRISVGAGEVTATLVPPDRTTYWSLSGNVHALESRLSDRGLRVKSLQVLEPGS